MTKPAAPTREELERWRELEKERLSFARQARDAKKLQEHLEESFLAYVKAEAGEKRRKVRYGFTLRIEDEKVNVSWKGEWLKDHSAEEALALADAQPTEEVLYVDPPAAIPAVAAKAA